MKRLFILALLPAAVMAQEPECYPWTWVPAPAVLQPAQPVNTTPKRVQKPRKSVHVGKPSKRVKARKVTPTTRQLPPLVRLPVECPKRPPVTEVFLPPNVTPPQPRAPGQPSMPYSPYVPVGFTPVPVKPAPPVVVAPPWFEGPLAVIPPGGFGAPGQSNDLPLPGGYVDTPGQVPLPSTLALLVIGGALGWRKHTNDGEKRC